MRYPKMTRKDYFTQYTYDGTKVNVIEKPGVEIVSFTNYQGKLCTLIWYGKQTKPSKYYAWTTEEKREAYIEERLLFIEEKETEKVIKAAIKKEAKHPYKVGDILQGSWGYGQTNVNFYQVTKATKKAIAIKQIGQTIEHTGAMCGEVKAVKNDFYDDNEYGGGEFKKIPQCWIHKEEANWYVKSPIHGNLRLWDGKACYKSWYH